MNAKVATKKQLIAGMSLDSFKPAMMTVFSHYEKYEHYGQVRYRSVYKEAEAGHQVAHAHGFTARVHKNGRVTLDVGYSYVGECFDGQVKGESPSVILNKALVLLHGAINNSNLNS